MPIAKQAIEKYLNREIEPKTWFKKLTEKDVEQELSYIKPRPKFTAPLFLHQKICFLMGIAYPETIFMTDLGTGKTSVSLELLSYFYHNNFIRRAFIFTPTNEVAEGWEDEIKKWDFTIPYVRLTQHSSEAKWETLAKFDNGLIIGTYIGIASMASELIQIDPSKKKRERVSQQHLLEKLFKDSDAVVFDQSTKLGNTTSLSYKTCKFISEKAQIRFSLAGRAFGRDPFVLWSQFYLTDHGKALGNRTTIFRSAFWRAVKTPWGVPEWVFRKRREKQLSYFITESSIRFSIKECVQLPPKIPVIKECTFPQENWVYYDQVREELLKSHGNYVECKNAFLRLRQISSGFIGFKDEETGDRAQIEFAENSKLDLLMELLEEVPEDKKIIIFHEFNWSGSRICQELTKVKYKYGWLWGGTKDWTKIKTSFNEDDDFRILVANWKKASMGLNLQTASYIFFYESPVSAIDRYECEGRIYRTGQKETCFIYDLVLRDSADESILGFHQEGGDLWRTLVENPSKMLSGATKKRIKL